MQLQSQYDFIQKCIRKRYVKSRGVVKGDAEEPS